MRNHIVAVLFVLAYLGSTPAQAGCNGIPLNGQCQGDMLYYCAFGVVVEVNCPSFGKTCGLKSFLGLIPYMSCVAGDSCGECASDESCTFKYQCVPKSGSCTPKCSGKQCGSDGCGGSCGTCPNGQSCKFDGTCIGSGNCSPDCAGKQCGGDGCGGSCGSCGSGKSCNTHQLCVSTGGCTPSCIAKECGADGCGGNCGQCSAGVSCNT